MIEKETVNTLILNYAALSSWILYHNSPFTNPVLYRIDHRAHGDYSKSIIQEIYLIVLNSVRWTVYMVKLFIALRKGSLKDIMKYTAMIGARTNYLSYLWRRIHWPSPFPHQVTGPLWKTMYFLKYHKKKWQGVISGDLVGQWIRLHQYARWFVLVLNATYIPKKVS